MNDASSSSDEKYHRLVNIVRFLLIPAFAVFGAAFVTGFPFYVNRFYPHETYWVQGLAMTTALGTGMAIAYFFRSASPKGWVDVLGHCFFLAFILLANHILWVQPLWGFHHTYTIGIFAWLLIGGDEGFGIVPNMLGFPLTLLASWGCLALIRLVLRISDHERRAALTNEEGGSDRHV